ncbi:MAG: hypothetical protein KDA84_12335, partial [Planctomycetaceae bacterium]|nr:hypothetical protein [Planctomycetaceae bacterium]
AWHYLAVARDLGVRGPEKYGQPRLASYIWMHSTNWLYGRTSDWAIFRNLPCPHEQAVGLGFVTTLVLGWFVVTYRRAWAVRILLTVILLVMLFCTVVPGGHTLYRAWYYTVPGIQAIRVMARIGILLAIPAGIALATFIDTRTRLRWAVASSLLGVFCCVEQIHHPPSYDTAPDRVRIAAITDALREQKSQEAFYVVPPSGPMGIVVHIDAMWAGLELGRPTLNGCSGNFPRDYGLFAPTGEELESALSDWSLRHEDLSFVTIQEQADGTYRRLPQTIAKVPQDQRSGF